MRYLQPMFVSLYVFRPCCCCVCVWFQPVRQHCSLSGILQRPESSCGCQVHCVQTPADSCWIEGDPTPSIVAKYSGRASELRIVPALPILLHLQ